MSRIAAVDPLVVPHPVLGPQVVVRVRTEDGREGIGQSGAWSAGSAVAALVPTVAGLVTGRDAGAIEAIGIDIRRHFAMPGTVVAALASAVDVALWDLAGQRYGEPIHRLLGGAVRERVPLCAIVPNGDDDDHAKAAGDLARQGFPALKVLPLPPGYERLGLADLLSRVRARVGAVRGTVGDGVDLVLEFHRALDAPWAPMVAEACAEFRPVAVEDLIQFDAPGPQGDVARRVAVPTAAGERLTTAREFADLLRAGGPMTVRPDVGLVGGIGGLRRIAALAEGLHALVMPHSFTGPIVTAAAAHVALTTPNLRHLEFSPSDEAEPWASSVRSAWRRDGGYLVPSGEPGLGAHLTRADGVDADAGGPARPLLRRHDGSNAREV